MNKQKIILMYSVIAVVTIGFIVMGFMFKMSDLEKMNGLTEIYDVSQNGTIAYVSYQEGKPGIYLKTEEEENLAIQYNEEKIVEDISFIHGENLLVYSLIDRDLDDDNNTSTIHLLDTKNGDNKKLHESNGIVTEVVVDPKDSGKIFFLKSSSYENYSPIARKAPHDIDIYRFDLENNEETKLTNWDKYSMDSLNISATEEIAYVQMMDDEDADTAEDIFAANQKVFQVPLDNPSELTIVSDENREIDIYDFVILPDNSGMIFQSISNFETGGTYQYELYAYDWDKGEEKQLTTFKQYAGNPIISTADGKIYFIVNKKFAKQFPDHYLYMMDINGENIEEVPLKYR